MGKIIYKSFVISFVGKLKMAVLRRVYPCGFDTGSDSAICLTKINNPDDLIISVRDIQKSGDIEGDGHSSNGESGTLQNIFYQIGTQSV